VKLLIDECLHTSLVELAHAAGHVADHVNYLGLGGLKDWQLMATIRQQEYTFVTNNRSDFLALHGREPLHAGVIIIVPSVTPVCQRELFSAALKHIGAQLRLWPPSFLRT
jgi:predicted nuclease of predicted toxin-antitoxin system